MRIYLTGHTLDWFNNHEYFKKVLKMVWIDHDDIHMEYFVENYIPLLIKKVVGMGDVCLYNPEVLFINCLSDDMVIDIDAFHKSLSNALGDFMHNYPGKIELILPEEYKERDAFEESIIKSLSITETTNSLMARTMTQLDNSLMKFS